MTDNDRFDAYVHEVENHAGATVYIVAERQPDGRLLWRADPVVSPVGATPFSMRTSTFVRLPLAKFVDRQEVVKYSTREQARQHARYIYEEAAADE